MTFELLCATLIALLFAVAVCFGGYRLFMFLLPIWGFFFGFVVGAQSVQYLLGQGFLGTVTGWVVGFIVALIFAVLSYLFYAFAVALIAASLGYALGVGIVGIFSTDLTVLAWLVGLVGAVLLVGLTLYLNLAKLVIILATAIGGAAAAVGTLLVGVENVDLLTFFNNPVRILLNANFIWAVLLLLMAVAGVVVQLRANRSWEVDSYNRMTAV
jgi:hypothetical protein